MTIPQFIRTESQCLQSCPTFWGNTLLLIYIQSRHKRRYPLGFSVPTSKVTSQHASITVFPYTALLTMILLQVLSYTFQATDGF